MNDYTYAYAANACLYAGVKVFSKSQMVDLFKRWRDMGFHTRDVERSMEQELAERRIITDVFCWCYLDNYVFGNSLTAAPCPPHIDLGCSSPSILGLPTREYEFIGVYADYIKWLETHTHGQEEALTVIIDEDIL